MPEKVKVKVGDKVIVSRGYGDTRVQRTVTSVARVWLIVSGGQRFRLDTQTDGSKYGSPPRFYTMEQWAQRERETADHQFLQGQGISIERGSDWTTSRLADLIRREINHA